MTVILRQVFYFGPIIFAVGFLAPLIAQASIRLGFDAPFGLSPLAFGFALAGVLGLVAQVRGRWL